MIERMNAVMNSTHELRVPVEVAARIIRSRERKLALWSSGESCGEQVQTARARHVLVFLPLFTKCLEEGAFSEDQLRRRGCPAKVSLPDASSIQAAIIKKLPKVRDPNGKAWSKVTKYAGSAINTRGKRGTPARQSATAAKTSATIQAYLPMSNRRVLKGSAQSVSMAATAARSPSAPTSALRARIPVDMPAMASPAS